MEWLLGQGFDLHLASSGQALHWLRRRFPGWPTLELPPYRIRYPSSSIELNMLMNGPGLWKAIRGEKKRIRSWAIQHQPVLLLSDCRFGARLPGIPSAYLSHHLNIAPGRLPLAHRIASNWQYGWIKEFSDCWVPDFPDEPNLSGWLGHPPPLRLNSVHYIGPLSSLPRSEPNPAFRIVALLSGPEPQRTYLEKKLETQLRDFRDPALIIRGQPEKAQDIHREGSLVTANWMTATQIAAHLQGAEMIIARPGYSTLMDLENFSIPCLLVPTPGQTEQEYLAQNGAARVGVRVQSQRELRVDQAFQALKGLSRNPVRKSAGAGEPLWQQRIHALLSR